MSDLSKQVAAAAQNLRKLKEAPDTPKEVVTAAQDELARLKKLLSEQVVDPAEEEKRKAEREEKKKREKEEKEKEADTAGKFEVKVPKGTRDFDPLEMAIRTRVIDLITNAFKRHGAVTIETPVFELKETLMGKYGEDSKLIYDLADQGGELLSLRYDLTVPFARYIALHRATSIKRYHIARVYRRDMPSEAKGRFREFYQCDFDIAGPSPSPMLPDAECLLLMTEILDRLPIGDYILKFNHRKLLDGMLEICNVPMERFRPVCSAIDKLDKEPWEKVQEELVQKGCSLETCAMIGKFVLLKGDPRTLLTEIVSKGYFDKSVQATQALKELDVLCTYLDVLEVPKNRLLFDLSLARGLDYYTGIIYEGVLVNSGGIGSICGGGRYDDLAGMFMSSGKTQQVPSVGFSLGLERLFAFMEQREKERSSGIRGSPTLVLVASLGKNMETQRLKICSRLWKADISTEHMYQHKLDLPKQLGFAEHNQIPFSVIFGEDELKSGKLRIKVMDEHREFDVDEKDLVDVLRKEIEAYKAKMQAIAW